MNELAEATKRTEGIKIFYIFESSETATNVGWTHNSEDKLLSKDCFDKGRPAAPEAILKPITDITYSNNKGVNPGFRKQKPCLILVSAIF